MRHLVIIHQKNGLPDLEDEYADEKAALDALAQIAVLTGLSGETTRATPSGKVLFKPNDFGGAQYTTDDDEE